jgi:hypothetical protein
LAVGALLDGGRDFLAVATGRLSEQLTRELRGALGRDQETESGEDCYDR